MKENLVRIGIDVGGTFTDAVVIDNNTLEIIAKRKIPTTHDSEEGVAKGIIDVIESLLKECEIDVKDVSFISHGTTQATNALLEGDVARIGIIGMGDGSSARNETNIPNIELAPGKFLYTQHKFLTPDNLQDDDIRKAIQDLVDLGSEVIVASESFSIENPENEQRVIEIAHEMGLYATGGYEISQLFGLKLRTRTATINGSLIPKMMETSLMTEAVVKNLGIEKDLMIMRADGGVMSVQEVKKRPILTMLSGLAAGIAGAIMHEKISEGIFIEIGGTSADISVIKDGRVMVKNASVGGHKTYLSSVDVKTVAIAGGTMIRVDDKGSLKVGPRSSHLAHLEYDCFGDIDTSSIEMKKIQPLKGDSDDYIVVEDAHGKRLALTIAGAANYINEIEKGDYSYSDKQSNDKVWECFGEFLNRNPHELAVEVLDLASAVIWNVIEDLKVEYEIEDSYITLYGGGGSAGVLTNYLGRKYNMKSQVVENAPFISTIGVALAMITEKIERSVINPNEDDIKRIRHDIVSKMLEMGALKETIEVSIEVDSLNHTLIASATGANEINPNQGLGVIKDDEELFELAKQSVGCTDAEVSELVSNESIRMIEVVEVQSGFMAKFKKKKSHIVALGHDGIIKYRRRHGEVVYGTLKQLDELLTHISDTYSGFSDAGQTIPEIIAFCKYHTFDYAGLMSMDQVRDIVTMDTEGIDENERILFLVTRRG